MWRELVQAVCSECAFASPASEHQLNDMEAALGTALPPELKALLVESNGIGDKYGRGVMSCEEIININLYLRADTNIDDVYMPFDNMFFFAAAVNSDMFFFPIQGNGKINNPDVFHWNHETDGRAWIAGDLSRFVEQWYSGQIDV